MSSLRRWIEATRAGIASLALDDSDEAFARLVEAKVALKKVLPLVAGSSLEAETQDAIRAVSERQTLCVRNTMTSSINNKMYGDELPRGGTVVLVVLGCANAAHQSENHAAAALSRSTTHSREPRGGRRGLVQCSVTKCGSFPHW